MAVLKTVPASRQLLLHYRIIFESLRFLATSDASDDARCDVKLIWGLFSAKIDADCIRLRSGKIVRKLSCLNLINEDFGHAGVRKYAGVSKLCITHYWCLEVFECKFKASCCETFPGKAYYFQSEKLLRKFQVWRGQHSLRARISTAYNKLKLQSETDMVKTRARRAELMNAVCKF